MKCPRCKDRYAPEEDEGKTSQVSTGSRKLDYLLACHTCSWQVPIRELEVWLKRWGFRK